jgi:hypothetical protein
MKWPWGSPTRPAATPDAYNAEPPQIFTNSLKANTISTRGLNDIRFPLANGGLMSMFVGLALDSRGFD